MKKLKLSLSALALTIPITANSALVTFEDLAPTQAYGGPGGGFYENGQNMTVISSSPGTFGGIDNANQFISDGVIFNNSWNDPGGSWNGFAYSNTTDTTTPGFGNQYSAYTGGGQGGSSNYGVAYDGADRIEFNSAQTVIGGYFTNTTYSVLSMLNGDAFAKKFGGETGNDEDWFLLTINGEDAGGNSTGSIEFYLADYRFADNSLDYIIDEWTYLDLSSLGAVSALTFDFTSSDVSTSGFINTPTYFAVDNIEAVPVPAAAWLFGSALMGLGYFRKRR